MGTSFHPEQRMEQSVESESEIGLMPTHKEFLWESVPDYRIHNEEKDKLYWQTELH